MASNLSHDAPPAAARAQHPQAGHPQADNRQAGSPQGGSPQGGHPQAGHPQGPPQIQHPQVQHPQVQQPPPVQQPQPQRPQPQHPLGFDPASWPLIRQSAGRLSWNQDAFIRQLHYDVTSLIPDPAGAPALDMWAFCDRMVQALLWVALTDQPLGVVADALRQVGAQNWVEGFPDTQYVNVAHALVQTVHYLSENDWSPSMGSVWISYFMWIKPHLLAGAQQAAAQYEAARRAAEQEAARGTAPPGDSRTPRDSRRGQRPPRGDASPLDDDDEDVGYGQIMVSMTRNPRRDNPRHNP